VAATCDINQINEDKIKRARKAVADEASLFGLAASCCVFVSRSVIVAAPYRPASACAAST